MILNMWWIRLFIYLLTYLMENLQISDVKIWKFIGHPSNRNSRYDHRQLLSCLALNNKTTIQYNSDTHKKIGHTSYLDKRYKILPFGSVRVIRNLRLNAKPISKCHKRKSMKARQDEWIKPI